VSLLFRERLLIRLSPAEVSAGDKVIACEPGFGPEAWQGAVAALKALPIEQKCDVTVELSNHFVRYALVPWSEALSTAAEEEAYVRHHFAKIHGDRAKTWAVRASSARHGAPRLASAVDEGLIDALRASFPRGGKARLVSVQPALMSVFNRSRGAIPRGGAWLALAEPDRSCVALHIRGQWRAVHSAKAAWLALLERTRLTVEDETPDVVLLHAVGIPPGEAPGWTVAQVA
jgi:hypothetical protein